MLRRADNVKFFHRPGFWTGKGPAVLRIGTKEVLLRKMSRREFQERLELQLRRPRLVSNNGGRRYWHYRNKFYWENEDLNSNQVHALITTRDQRRSQQIERAQATVAIGSQPRSSTSRKRVPDDVRQYVMTRDGGKCQHCGSTADIQFDHIIPVSMGGGTTIENLELLCGPCNQFKGAGLTNNR